MYEDELKVVGIRLNEEASWYSNKILDSPKAVVEFISEKLKGYDREVFCILNLSTKTQIINMNFVSVGTLNSTLTHPRETFKSAILSNAACIMLLHNHPSGNCEPSEEDIQITKRLEKCGELMGIQVMDHIILGANHQFFSFKEEGLMQLKKSMDFVAQA